MTEENLQSSSSDDKNVLPRVYENALVDELERSTLRAYISKEKIEEIAIEKYRSNGNGITFKDVVTKFSIKKRQAQRSLKHFHARGVLFTAEDLICQGIDLVVFQKSSQIL
jgi:Fic family protein